MSKNTTNNRGRGGGRGGGRGRGGRGGRGGGAAGNGSTISLVTDQPFETLSTEEQDMIKYLHRVSKNSKSAFSAILKKEDNEASSAAVAEDSSSSTLQHQQQALQQVDTTPVIQVPVVAAHPGFTLPPKRNKRSRDDDDDDIGLSAAASSQPVVTTAVVLSTAVASPAPAAGSLPKPPSSMSIIGKWRSQLQALAPPSLPLNWLPNVTFVQSTENRFQAHRSRIEAMRTETIEAISHFHDFNEEDEVNNNSNEEGTTTVLHIGRRIGGGAGNTGGAAGHHHHHKSISEASGRSKYSSVQSGSDGVDEEVEGRPSTHTLRRIQAIFNAIMTKKQQGEESASSSRIHELITKNLPASRCPWSQGFTKAQQEDIAAAAASIAVRVPYLLAPLGHVLVSSTLAEDEEGLTDLQVAEGLVSSIGFFPLQQSLMSMWFHCLSLCIGSSVRQMDTEGAPSHAASCRGSAALLPPVRPLMTMFALVGDGDTNNLLHAVLGVILNGAEGVVGSVVGAKSQVAEAEPVCEDDDDDDIVRPGKGMASLVIENEGGDEDEEEEEYAPKEAGASSSSAVALLQLPPAPGAESLKAYAAAASVNNQIVRAWRHSLHSADTTSGLLQCVDTCVTTLYPVASVGLDDFQAGGGAAPTCGTSSELLNKVVEALRFTAQLVPLGYTRHLASAAQGQVLPIETSGMGEWLYTAFAAVELPLDPQGDIQMQRLYRLTLRTIHTLRTATQDVHKLATLLLYPRLRGGIESVVDRVVAGFLALVSVGGSGKSSSLSCLTSLTHTQLSNELSQAVDRILAAHETNLTILCKFFISHNKDLVPI